MAGRKPIIATEESAPASPLRRSSRISSSTTAPISGRRSSATAVEAPPVAKIIKGKRLSLSQDNTEERPGTPKRTTKITRAASSSPTAVKETVGTPAKRGRKSSVTKTEEDKSQSTTPSTVATRRRSLRGQSTSPTSDKAEPVKPRGRRPSVTEKIAPLVPIDESDEVKKPATRARRTSVTSRRASNEESNDGSTLDKRVLTVQLTQLDNEVKKTPGRRGRPSKAALEEVESKKAKIQELNPIIETSFTEESQEKMVTPNKESPKTRSKSPKKSLSADIKSPLHKTSINNKKSVKTLFDNDVEEENFELTVEDNDEDSVNKKHNENKSEVILEAVAKQDVELKESIKSPKKVLKEDTKIEESTKSPRRSLRDEGSKIEKAKKSPKNDLKGKIQINESIKSPKKDIKEDNKIEEVIKSPKRDIKINQSKIEDKDLDHDAKKDSNKKRIVDESEDISKAKIDEDTVESMDVLEVSSSVCADKSVTILPEKQSPTTIKSKLSISESEKVLTPKKDKQKSLSSENLNKSTLKDDSSFKSPRINKKKTDDPLLINPLEMTFGSDGSFHLNLSIPASNNSQEKNENKSKGSDKLNTTGGSDNSDKENLSSPLSSPEKTVSDKIKDFSVLSVESKMNTSTPRISLNSSKTKPFSEDMEVEFSNQDSPLSKSIGEDVSTTRKSLGNVSKLIEEEKEFSSSPIKKMKPVINKVEEKAVDESKILDSFVDEVTEEVLEEEDLDEEEISKILETPKSSPTRVQSDLSSEQKKTERAEDIGEDIDVETAVTIIKGSPETKRLSLKLNQSSEECLIEEDNQKSACVQEDEGETNEEILEATSNEKDTTMQISHIANDSSCTPEKKQTPKESPKVTSCQKKRLTKNTEETPSNISQVDLKENVMGNKNTSPYDKKLNTQSPKLNKSSVEQNVESENNKSQDKEELASAYKNPKLDKSLVDETVIIVDDDVFNVAKTPKRKSLKLKTSSTEDSPNLKTESENEQGSQSDKGSNENCPTHDNSKKKKRRSKKILECAGKSLSNSVDSEEIIEIDENSLEVHTNMESMKYINNSRKLDVQDESNDVEFINEKNVKVHADILSDDVEFVENISPKKKCKKDKRKSKTIEIKDDTNTETKGECKATPSKMNKKIEDSINENEIVEMQSQDSTDKEIVVAKSPIRLNKGSKRIKRDIALIEDQNVASKTDVLSTNSKKSIKEKQMSQKRGTSEQIKDISPKIQESEGNGNVTVNDEGSNDVEFDDTNMKGNEDSKTTPSQMTKESEESKIENEPVVEVINDQENSVAKSPIISSKGSKRIKRDVELIDDENVASKTDIICNDGKISKREKRMSLKRETLEEIEVTDSPCLTPQPSSKKKRKSLKKRKSEEKANVTLNEEESNEVEFVRDSNKEEKREKISPVTETQKSKRIKKASEEETLENDENEITNISIKSTHKETSENYVNSNKTPKKGKRRSKKQQIENDLFGVEPSNKEELSNVVLSSKDKLKETKQKTEVKNEMDGYSGESDCKDDDELDSTVNDHITTKLVSEDEEINSDESDEDFVEPVFDFFDCEAIEGSPESSPSHSNDIVDEGESLHSSDTEEECDLFDEEDYENDSFIDDDESGELLSGNEYDLSDEKTKKKRGDKTKKKTRIVVVSDSEEENRTEKKNVSKDLTAPQVTEDEYVDTEDNIRKINIIQNIVISPQTAITENNETYDIEEIESEKIVEQDELKTKTELKLLSDTPNNSFADTSTSQTKRKKSKRKTSISIQEKLSLTESTDTEINEKISKAVDFFCSSIKDKTGNVSLNVSLDYANNSNSSEDADRKVTKREINIQEVIPSIGISQPSVSNPSKSKKRYSLQEQFTNLSESPDVKRRRSALPEFTISENSNKNKRKSVELLEVVEQKKKSRTSLTESNSVQETKSKKTKAIQPGTNVQYLPEDILVAVVNSSPKVSSSEIIEPKNSRTIKKKKIKIAPSVKMNPAADWEIDEVVTKPSKNNKKGEQQKLSKKLQQYIETFPSNDFKNRTLYNPKRNRRQDSKQILANKRSRL